MYRAALPIWARSIAHNSTLFIVFSLNNIDLSFQRQLCSMTNSKHDNHQVAITANGNGCKALDFRQFHGEVHVVSCISALCAVICAASDWVCTHTSYTFLEKSASFEPAYYYLFKCLRGAKSPATPVLHQAGRVCKREGGQ